MEIKDSGQREQFSTGSQRDTEDGKPRLFLLPFRALWRVGMHYTKGADKYTDRNWEKGQPFSRLFSSALRHLFQWAMGDREEDHLSAAVFNILAIIHFEEIGRTDLDDLSPDYGKCLFCNEAWDISRLEQPIGGFVQCPNCPVKNRIDHARKRYTKKRPDSEEKTPEPIEPQTEPLDISRHLGLCGQQIPDQSTPCKAVWDMRALQTAVCPRDKSLNGVICTRCGSWCSQLAAHNRLVAKAREDHKADVGPPAVREPAPERMGLCGQPIRDDDGRLLGTCPAVFDLDSRPSVESKLTGSLRGVLCPKCNSWVDYEWAMRRYAHSR